jgi:hypothetical protein
MILVLISDTIVLYVAVSELGLTPAITNWRAFSAALAFPRCRLEKLDLSSYTMCDHAYIVWSTIGPFKLLHLESTWNSILSITALTVLLKFHTSIIMGLMSTDDSKLGLCTCLNYRTLGRWYINNRSSGSPIGLIPAADIISLVLSLSMCLL